MTTKRPPNTLVALFSSAFCAAAILTAAGCQKDAKLTTTELQMSRMDEGREHFGGHMTYMADNALLQDMSVADFHFVGHSTELSGSGAARLDRMAVLLDTYGGTVRYETVLDDDELVASRLDHVREYLEVVGCDMSKVEVKVALTGGWGMAATDAVAAQQRMNEEARSGQQGGSTIVGPGMMLPGGGR